jgi:transcriptional adapter 2-alpha
MQKAEKNKTKEEKDLVQRYKVFAKAQTAEDFEVLLNGLHCKRILLATFQQHQLTPLRTF